jgi:hypothetical protein
LKEEIEEMRVELLMKSATETARDGAFSKPLIKANVVQA